MKVTVELDPYMVEAIAERIALDRAYDWSTNPDWKDDINKLYLAAFAEGMNYVLNLIEGNDTNGTFILKLKYSDIKWLEEKLSVVGVGHQEAHNILDAIYKAEADDTE